MLFMKRVRKPEAPEPPKSPEPPPRDERLERATAAKLFDISDLRDRPRWTNEAIIRSLCSSAYLGNETAVCRILGRYKALVDTQDETLGIHLITEGYWEMWLTEMVARHVKPGMIVADVGANLGYFSLLFADLVGSAGHVHCFEPNPPIAALLRSTLSMNGMGGRATIHEVALGDVRGTAQLHVPRREPGAAKVVTDASSLDSITVPAERLDGFPTLHDVDLVKIDVEGAEIDVWRGMRKIIETNRPLSVVVEFCATRYADPGSFLSELTVHGLEMSVIDPVEGVVDRSPQDILTYRKEADQLLLLTRGTA